MPYQRCISTLGCPALTLPETLGLAAAHHLDAVELRSLGGRIDLPTFLAEQHGSPAQLAANLVREPIRITSLDTSLKLLANTDADRDAFLEFVPWAEALQVPWLRLFDGGKDFNADLPTAIETFQWWHELKARHGWRTNLMIETHDVLFDSGSILALTAACPGLGILWDTHHTWKNSGEQPVDTWHAIKAHVVHLHVKDSVSIPSARHPFSYRLPGEGEFPMATLRPLLDAEFSGCVSLEWERHWHPDLAPIEDALSAAAANRWW